MDNTGVPESQPSPQTQPQVDQSTVGPAEVVSALSQTSVSDFSNTARLPGKKPPKALTWGIRAGLLVVFLVVFLLGILPGKTSYLTSSLNGTSSSDTPASCTTNTRIISKSKGFPLAYSFSFEDKYTFNCVSTGQGIGQGSSQADISPSNISTAWIGVAVDAASAIVATIASSLGISLVMRRGS